MSGKRVFELAKDLGVSSKELIDDIKKLGIAVSSHMTVLDDKTLDMIKNKASLKEEESHKISEVFKGVKSSTKAILIKKKVKPEAVEELPVTQAEQPASVTIVTVESPVSTAGAEERIALKTEVEEKLIIPSEKEEPTESPAESATSIEKPGEIIIPSVSEGKAVEPVSPISVKLGLKPAVEAVKPKEKGTPDKVEKAGVKEQKKKGLKVIVTEPEDETLISHRWKSFKTIPKKEKKGKGFGAAHRRLKQAEQPVEITKPRKKVIKLYEGTTVKEFADMIGIKSSEIMAKLIDMGMMVTINHPVDIDAAVLIADTYGLKVEVAAEKSLEEYIEEGLEESQEVLKPRAPVVTVMGHVDHGKTSLLDAIRKTRVTEGEAGGITQHIGAYVVETGEKRVVFLDTPGHEAFTAMRARGAKVTDIVILVVAADDGVMPQTIEAINHAKAANVPIIVAINKIDKPGSNPERIRQELTKYGLVPEAWGGQNIFVEVSAKQRIGLEHLIEMVLLQAEVLELKANPDKNAKGVILEAKLDKGRGPVATVLVESGSLMQGDSFVCGTFSGRVRMLLNDKGKPTQVAQPATPVEVIGFSGVPQAGDTFAVVDDEHIAKSIAASRLQKQRIAGLEKAKKVTLDELYSQIKNGAMRELNIIIKADVQGSVEAVGEALERLGTDVVKVRMIHGGVGGITETDVMLASASNAIIIGFNVRPEPKALSIAEKEKLDIRLYNIIYDAVADIKAAMEGLLEPTFKEQVTGRAEVRQVFAVSKVGTIAGCYILDGTISRASTGVRLIRDNVEVYKGKIGSLKRFKDDVKEVHAGYECGIGIENFNDIKSGDIIEAFIIEKIAAKL
ncbi:MAG: translation initiation factor IF-2 [Nitrospirae bacterium]|nr:translation initiation factor IF-2 [Nitrospirota bacterium]